METTTAPVAGDSRPPMSEIGRIVGVFWDPRPVFEDIAARPRFWAPLILIVLAAVLMAICINQIVGLDTILERQMAENARFQSLSPEQQAMVLKQQGAFAPVMAYVGALLVAPIVLLATASFLLLLYKVTGATELTFRQSFSIVNYAWLPNILSTLAAIAVMSSVHPSDFNIENPAPFNLGWLPGVSESSTWLKSLLSSIDLFSFWVLALMAFGFSIAVRKLTFGKSMAVVVFAWALFVVVKVGWTAMFN